MSKEKSRLKLAQEEVAGLITDKKRLVRPTIRYRNLVSKQARCIWP